MKPIFYLTISLFIGVILPLNNGLRCYECVSEEGLEDGFAPYHKKCKEGDLPNHLGVDCSVYNQRNPKTLKRLTPEEIDLQQNGKNITWMCTKLQGKLEGKDLTVKRCAIQAYWDDPRDEVDRCGDDRDSHGSTLKFCNCIGDLCNGANIPSKFNLLTILISTTVIDIYNFY